MILVNTQSFKTLVGGELKEYTQMMNEARALATKRMVEEAEALGADAIVNLEKLAFYLSVDPYKIYTETEFITAVKQAYEAEKQRLREETEAAEREKAREKERENELTLLRNAIKKRWATVTSDNEDSEELTDESIAADTAKEQHDAKEREFDSIRNVFKKHFGQKHPLDEFSDAITLLDNFII